jgi:hypothetical protein
MTPLLRVNQTFDAEVVEVPNPFLAALGQCASSPGAPGATLLVASANKGAQEKPMIVEMTIARNIVGNESRCRIGADNSPIHIQLKR